MFIAGTDTTYTVLEWAMAELLRHPKAMKKLQNEVMEIGNGKPYIRENDLDKMHYLKAVIKEVLHLYPPVPLLVPRESTQDVNINGYDIAAGTLVITNAWAIGRDPKVCDKPEENSAGEAFGFWNRFQRPKFRIHSVWSWEERLPRKLVCQGN